MSIRIRKSIPVGKYAKVNISKGGASLSAHAGPVTVNSRGKESVHVAPGVTLQSNQSASHEAAPKQTAGSIVWSVHLLFEVAAAIMLAIMLFTSSTGLITPFCVCALIAFIGWLFGTKPTK